MFDENNYPKLDWKPRFDSRSLGFLISDHFHLGVEAGNRNWRRGAWLDQGQEGACTGFGAAHVLAATPKARPDMNDAMARSLYKEAQRNDEWPGENYEGSSVLGAMQALKARNWITEYYWAKSLDEIKHGVSLFGPMEIGVNWYSGMWKPDDNGVLHVSGTIVGGHALCVGGIDFKKGLFRLDNSWGKNWGINGSAWISFEDMDRLRSEDGEFALPRKRKYALI